MIYLHRIPVILSILWVVKLFCGGWPSGVSSFQIARQTPPAPTSRAAATTSSRRRYRLLLALSNTSHHNDITASFKSKSVKKQRRNKSKRPTPLSNDVATDSHSTASVQFKAYRQALLAWTTQLSHASASARGINYSRRPGSPNELEMWRGLARKAHESLERMERISRETAQKPLQQETRTLLTATDYEPVVLALCQTQLVVDALQCLRRWQRLFVSLDYLESLAPSTRAYTSTMRAILLNSPSQWAETQGIQQYSPPEMAHFLWKECYGLYNTTKLHALRPNCAMYNTLLDGWSKVFPPPGGIKSRRRRGRLGQKESPLLLASIEQTDKLSKETVARQATLVWESMNIQDKDAQSYALMIYIYCKCDLVEEAFHIWEALLDLLLSTPDKRERVDSRSFRMLARCLAQQKQADRTDNAKHIESIIDGMWDLHDAGYFDTAPDIFIYTTAMNAWADSADPSSTDRCRALLEELESKHEILKWKSLKPDVAVYNALVNAVARERGPGIDVAGEAGSIVKKMEREASINSSMTPNTITYNTLIDACLSFRTREGVERAEQTLLWMSRELQKGNSRVRPTLRSFTSVILAWTELTEPGVAARAEKLLDRLEERYRPPGKCYEAVILSWCREANEPTGVETETHPAYRAKLLLDRMEQVFQATGNENEMMRPRTALYNSVSKALSEAGDVAESEEAEKVRQSRDRMYTSVESTLGAVRFVSAEEVFNLMGSLDNASSSGPEPIANTLNFNMVISRLAKSGQKWAGQRAEDVLNFMLELSLKRGNKNITPSIVTFNSVMAAWKNSGRPDSGEKAHTILGKLEALHKLGFLTEVEADRTSFNTIMGAYAKSPKKKSAEMAEKVFRQLEELYEKDGDESLKPDIVSYSTLLNAWAHSDDPGGPRHAEEILLELQKNHRSGGGGVKPDTQCFNEVIYAYAKSGKKRAAKQAEMILSLLEDMEDVRPDLRTYNIVLLAVANSNDGSNRALELLNRMKAGDAEVHPSLISYSTAIAAMKGPDGLKAIERLFDDVLDSDLEPDEAFFSSMLHSLSKLNTKGAPAVAEKIVDAMKRLIREGKLSESDLNTRIYNALINVYAKSGERGAAARAEAILQNLEDKSAQGKSWISPDVRTYTLVIDAYAKSREPDAAKRAEAILNGMDGRLLKPNVHTYTGIIQNYARSDLPSKATHAQAVLQRMKDDYANGNEGARPNIFSYNAVLNACEFSSGDNSEVEQAFKVACTTMDEIRSSDYLHIDHVTYGSFLGVLANLMPKSDMRTEMVELLFRKCQSDGMVGAVVLKKLKDAAPPSLYSKLLADVKQKELPREWTRNVVERR